jgi:hypothetical protein
MTFSKLEGNAVARMSQHGGSRKSVRSVERSGANDDCGEVGLIVRRVGKEVVGGGENEMGRETVRIDSGRTEYRGKGAQGSEG